MTNQINYCDFTGQALRFDRIIENQIVCSGTLVNDDIKFTGTDAVLFQVPLIAHEGNSLLAAKPSNIDEAKTILSQLVNMHKPCVSAIESPYAFICYDYFVLSNLAMSVDDLIAAND